MTGKFSNQGIISGTEIIHTAPDNNMSEIRLMRFTNDNAFDVVIKKYTSSTLTTTTLYSLTLAAGDIFTDDNPYYLDENDRLEVESHVSGTTFFADGEDSPRINVVRCR